MMVIDLRGTSQRTAQMIRHFIFKKQKHVQEKNNKEQRVKGHTFLLTGLKQIYVLE